MELYIKSRLVVALRSERIEKIQMKLESVTRKWWFFLILLLMQFLPPFTSEPISPDQAGLVIGAVLSEALVYDLSTFFPIFKILSIFMIASVFVFKNRVSQIFSLYVGVMYVLFAFFQSIAFTEEFGLAIVTANLLMFLLVALTWVWEGMVQKSDLETPQLNSGRIWVIPFSLLAFWYPINLDTMMIDLNPLLIFTNVASLAFCMMTPVFLSVLILFYPNINFVTLRMTSSIGIIISVYNILSNFIMFPELLFWNGILHIPLTIISVYAFALSIHHRTNDQFEIPLVSTPTIEG